MLKVMRLRTNVPKPAEFIVQLSGQQPLLTQMILKGPFVTITPGVVIGCSSGIQLEG